MNDIHVLLSFKHGIGTVYEHNELNGRKPVLAHKVRNITEPIEMFSFAGNIWFSQYFFQA